MEKHKKSQNPYDVELPQSIIESFARFLLPEICEFYASEEGQETFREWQEQQKNNKF